MKKLLPYFLIASIFITGNGLGELGFTFQWYYIIYIPFLIFGVIVFGKIDRRILVFLVCLFVFSFLNIHPERYPYISKQLINITFSLFVFYFLLAYEKFDLEAVFQKYVAFSKVILVIGFIQIFLFSLDLFGVHAGQYFLAVFPFLKSSDISFRFQSITQEPSYLAYVFAPIVFSSIYGFFSGYHVLKSKIWSALFIVAYLATFSVIAYGGIVLSVTLIFFRKMTVQKIFTSVIFFVCIYMFCIMSYNYIPLIKLRVDDSLEGITEGIVENGKFKDVNLSTYAILTNAYVAKKSFLESPFSGSGIGTYELMYDEFLPDELKDYAIVNREDANSMGLRIAAETGVMGLIFIIWFLAYFKIPFKDEFLKDKFYWVLNSGVLIMILLFLVRNGNYTLHGKMFFILIYYYSYYEAKRLACK